MNGTCPGCGAGPLDPTQQRERVADYWCGTIWNPVFGAHYSIECFTNQLFQRDARIKELEDALVNATKPRGDWVWVAKAATRARVKRLRVGMKVRTEYRPEEKDMVRTLLQIHAAPDFGSGYWASADGGEACPTCGRKGLPILGVDAAWCEEVT